MPPMEKFTKLTEGEGEHQDSGYLSGNISSVQTTTTSSVFSALSVSSSTDIGVDSGINLGAPTELRWEHIYSQDDVGDTLLHRILASTAASRGKDATSHHQIILQILRSTPTPDLLDVENNWGQTALHVACEHEDEWSARRLILAGATADRPDDLRFTPLHIAAQKGNAALVQAIIQPVSADELSELGLQYYAVTPAPPRTKLLELNQLCSLGMTPMHLSVKSGNLFVLEELLPFATHLDTRELLEGRTALHLAIDLRRSDMVRALLKAAAATEIEDYAGRTPLERLLRFKLVDKSEELDKCLLLLRASGAMEPDEDVSEDEVDEDDTSDDDKDLIKSKQPNLQGCRPKD